MNSNDEIRQLLQTFQDGYTRRDTTQVNSFMELFVAEAEVIGTNGVRPGVDEWYMDRLSARELVESDWQGWGDVRLDLDSMSIHSRGEAGWVAASATVTQTIGDENYASYLEFVKKYIDRPDLSAPTRSLVMAADGPRGLRSLGCRPTRHPVADPQDGAALERLQPPRRSLVHPHL